MKIWLFLVVFIVTGCSTQPKPNQVLPASETIIKIKAEDNVIAESQDRTYFFISPKAVDQLKNYREFLADFKDDIDKVAVNFYQYSQGNSVKASYYNYIQEKKFKAQKARFEKYRKSSFFRNGYYILTFEAQGSFITQPNILTDQYRLSKPLIVPIVQDKLDHGFIKPYELILAPLYIPIKMIGCLTGRCI